MPGVPRELIEHELYLNPKDKPVKQRLHHFAQGKKDVIKREIARLLDARFIKEVYHMDWLINHVLVPRKNKDWRMCVEYTNLNKACKRITLACHESIRLWTPQPAATFKVSLIATPGIIIFPSRKKTKSRHPSSLHLAHFVIEQCHSDSKVQGQHIKGVYNGVCILNSGTTQKCTLTT
jgi:hypothetical protein